MNGNMNVKRYISFAYTGYVVYYVQMNTWQARENNFFESLT
jgi:hypothetical protein